MVTTPRQSYGFHGYSEFNENRRKILSDYFQSKSVNKNRPVRTQHGVAGEAALRAWLRESLPRKFDVTSGYVIPDFVSSEYDLLEYDLIIFDALEAPVLWVDATADRTRCQQNPGNPS